MSELKLTQADDGKSFAVHVGDTILVELAERPTTGYRWTVPPAIDLLDLEHSSFSPGPGGGVGGGGQRTLTFKVKNTGVADLQLKLRRSWESEESAVQTFRVTIEST